MKICSVGLPANTLNKSLRSSDLTENAFEVFGHVSFVCFIVQFR